jgi:hypothetical protein
MKIRNLNSERALMFPTPQPYGAYNYPRPTYGGSGAPNYEGSGLRGGCQCEQKGTKMLKGLVGLGALGLGANGTAAEIAAESALNEGLGPDESAAVTADVMSKVLVWQMIIGVVGATAGAYHGYRRNKSAGWALAWGVFGYFLPVIALPVAFVQGFGKRRGRR